VTADGGVVWVAGDQKVARLDAASGRTVLTYGLGDLGGGGGGRPGLVAVTPDAVWVWSGTTLLRFDPPGELVTGSVPGVFGVSGLVVGEGMLWAITGDGVVRVDPERAT
jgi:hypothetical protein